MSLLRRLQKDDDFGSVTASVANGEAIDYVCMYVVDTIAVLLLHVIAASFKQLASHVICHSVSQSVYPSSPW